MSPLTDEAPQLNAMSLLSGADRDPMYLAFSAAHLSALVAALREMNLTTQHWAVSTYIQILSVLPRPPANVYLRRFLRSPSAAGLPNLVARHFVAGIECMRPSGPGHLCALFADLLVWCSTHMGDDRHASMDKALRDKVAAKVGGLCRRPDLRRLPEGERDDMDRLLSLMRSIDSQQAGSYVKATRRELAKRIPSQKRCGVCTQAAGMTCSQCKAVRYCRTECQTKAWKSGHNLTCWRMLDADGHDF